MRVAPSLGGGAVIEAVSEHIECILGAPPGGDAAAHDASQITKANC